MQAHEALNDHAATAAHAFGALATRLYEALGRARQALDAHTRTLPDATFDDLDALRAEFERRRLRIAVYGEVKAGKSTLVNAIAGALLSPVGFEPLTSVPVRITYGPATAWRVRDRLLDSVTDLERCMRDGLGGPRVDDACVTDARVGDTRFDGVSEVVVETDLDMLQLGGQVDLVDTPGVGSAARFDALTADALRSLDAVVLVVRYPALFTQFTRRLMDGLQADIGKLFVVWNLDAACADLTPEERRRHADSLRANVAGAHELVLVDARAGLRAMEADDGAGSVASGLTALIAGLTRFASSRGREVAALREAAKRASQRLDDAQQCLTARHTALDQSLAATRARLNAVQATADAASATARTQCAECTAALARIGRQATAHNAARAMELRRHLRGARRRWVRRGHIGALEAAVATAAERYADAVEAGHRETITAMEAALTGFGASVSFAPPARSNPAAAPLASGERVKRATHGRWQLLRRAVWHRWYLPGLAALQRTGIAAAAAVQAAWLSAALQAAHDGASATLSARLAEITQHAEAEMQQIKLETDFSAQQTEFERLAQDVPVVAAQREALGRIGTEARALL